MKLMVMGRLTGIVAVLAAAGAMGQEPRPAAWEPEQAAKYLDDRMDLWFDKAAKPERRGQDLVRFLPHGRALPAGPAGAAQGHESQQPDAAGNQAPGGDGPAGGHLGPERTALREQRETVPRGPSRCSMPWSWQTPMPVRAGRNRARLPARPSGSCGKRSVPDGAWDWLDFGSEPDESADARYHGAALAALAVGTAPRLVNGLQAETSASNPVGKLRAYLNGEYARQNLYNRTWLLLASSRLAGLLSPEQRRLLMGELRRSRTATKVGPFTSWGPWRWSKANPP